MKRYRLTKITVKTRETISLSSKTESETQNPVCPICHSPLPVALPAESSVVASNLEQSPSRLPPAEISGDQD